MIKKAILISTNFLNEEKILTYSFNEKFTFNRNLIANLTITDHYQNKKGRENINDEVIIELILKLNNLIVPPRKKLEKRDIYVVEWLNINDKFYRLIFWFKDGTVDHLWIRNCYRID